MTVLSQIFKLMPRNLISKLANAFGIDKQSHVFSQTSHVLALVFGQLTHAVGLNDICDTHRNHCGLKSKIRDCIPPGRNSLSHAKRNRDANMAEKLFWEVLALRQVIQNITEILQAHDPLKDTPEQASLLEFTPLTII